MVYPDLSTNYYKRRTFSNGSGGLNLFLDLPQNTELVVSYWMCPQTNSQVQIFSLSAEVTGQDIDDNYDTYLFGYGAFGFDGSGNFANWTDDGTGGYEENPPGPNGDLGNDANVNISTITSYIVGQWYYVEMYLDYGFNNTSGNGSYLWVINIFNANGIQISSTYFSDGGSFVFGGCSFDVTLSMSGPGNCLFSGWKIMSQNTTTNSSFPVVENKQLAPVDRKNVYSYYPLDTNYVIDPAYPTYIEETTAYLVANVPPVPEFATITKRRPYISAGGAVTTYNGLFFNQL